MKSPKLSTPALFRSLPFRFKASWLLIACGVVAMAAGYALRLSFPGWVGVVLFITGYGLPFAGARPPGDAGGLYVTGLIMSTVTAAILLSLQLVIALVLAGVLLITGHFHVEGALRILHIIGLLTATGVLLTIPRAARIVAAQR